MDLGRKSNRGGICGERGTTAEVGPSERRAGGGRGVRSRVVEGVGVEVGWRHKSG